MIFLKLFKIYLKFDFFILTMNLTEYTNLIKTHSVCIFFFYSNDCQNLYNTISSIETSNQSKIFFIDVEQNIELVKELKLKSYPFFKIYKNNVLIENIIGTYQNIDNIINLHIS